MLHFEFVDLIIYWHRWCGSLVGLMTDDVLEVISPWAWGCGAHLPLWVLGCFVLCYERHSRESFHPYSLSYSLPIPSLFPPYSLPIPSLFQCHRGSTKIRKTNRIPRLVFKFLCFPCLSHLLRFPLRKEQLSKKHAEKHTVEIVWGLRTEMKAISDGTK